MQLVLSTIKILTAVYKDKVIIIIRLNPRALKSLSGFYDPKTVIVIFW